jgi:coproporphyrinogen III oxidase
MEAKELTSSLPETARWEYMSQMGKEGTREGELLEVLRKPRDWA